MSFKILSAKIVHETNTFNIHPTTLQSFRNRYLLDGDQAIIARGNHNTELAGMLDVGRKIDGILRIPSALLPSRAASSHATHLIR